MRVPRLTVLGSLMVFACLASVGRCAHEGEWLVLSDSLGPDIWRSGPGEWFVSGDARINPTNDHRLVGVRGTGVLINGPTGRTVNLLTKADFSDVEFHGEFFIPKGSNSGVKFEGLYEVQIFDSYGREVPKGDDCGGIYPKAELLPTYHHLDDGIAPRINASKPPGEWQTLDVVFQTPRFDAAGKKTANARMVQVVLNGKVVHENLELKYPTGHAWSLPELPKGPIMLQADHGPVAFRNLRVREWKEGSKVSDASPHEVR